MSAEKWPEVVLSPTDRFVENGQPDFQLNACVGRQLANDRALSYYSDGFLVAARRLTDLIIEEDSALRVDIAVYPVVFLYRHHFELLLKGLINVSRQFLGESGRDPFGHNLEKLWLVARRPIERCFKDANWSHNEFVTSLMAELSFFDPNGEAGRYPLTTKGAKHFKSISILNVRHFAQVAERLSEYLSSILFAIEATHDLRMGWENRP